MGRVNFLDAFLLASQVVFLAVCVLVTTTTGQTAQHRNLTTESSNNWTTSHISDATTSPNPSTFRYKTAFDKPKYSIKSQQIRYSDSLTLLVPDFRYDAGNKSTYFVLHQKNATPSASSSVTLPYENGSPTTPLRSYHGENVTLSLPPNYLTYDVLSVWWPLQAVSLDQIYLPPQPVINVTFHKCCPLGQVRDSVGNCTDSSLGLDPELEIHEYNATHVSEDPIPAQLIRFTSNVKDLRCENKGYPLEDNIDNFFLLRNGTLLLASTGKFLGPDEFCVETVDISEDTDSGPIWSTTPIICFGVSERPVPEFVFRIYAAGVLISSILLIATAVVFFCVKEIRDTRGKCVIGYASSMGAAFIILAIAQLSGIPDDACKIFGYFMQFFLVLSFSWLTMLTFETFYKIKNYNNRAYGDDRRRFHRYVVLGIIVPLVMFCISMVIDNMPGLPSSFLKPKFGRNACWFNQGTNSYVHFYAPIGFLILIDIILAVLMKVLFLRYERYRSNDISFKTTRIDLKPMFRSCVFVLSVMTLCWVVEIVTYAVQDLGGIGIALDIINSLQGVMVFVIFVLHRPISDQLKRLVNQNKLLRKTEDREGLKTLQPRNGDPEHAANNHHEFLTDLNRIESVEDLTLVRP